LRGGIPNHERCEVNETARFDPRYAAMHGEAASALPEAKNRATGTECLVDILAVCVLLFEKYQD